MRIPNVRIGHVLLMACAVVALSAGAAQSATTVDLSGSWHGYWQSSTTGHQGPLNARFCRINENCYRVTFMGRFFKILPFRYSVTLRVVGESENCVTLAGSHNLGRLLGTFSYRATATGCSFRSNYYSQKDCGRFVLHRCCSAR